VFPSNGCEQDLANAFDTFFLDKINTIRDHFSDLNKQTSMDVRRTDKSFEGKSLDCFTSASEAEVQKIVMASPSKSC
jgi:hypothetical protein